MKTLRLRQCRDINPRKRPFAGKGPNLIAELLNLLVANLSLFRSGGYTDKVLKKLAARFLLQEKRELNGTVQKFTDNLDVFFLHVTGGEGRGAKTNTTGNLGRSIARNGILWQECESS